MMKSELISRMAKRFPDFREKDAYDSVNFILDEMGASPTKGERIEIRGFGRFALNYRPPRNGRNPKTGAAVNVPGKHVPHFKPGKDMRERILSAKS
jgi:integration host factor subunit beta